MPLTVKKMPNYYHSVMENLSELLRYLGLNVAKTADEEVRLIHWSAEKLEERLAANEWKVDCGFFR